MATFPRTEADLIELATRMISGLEEHRWFFTSPPVSSSEIKSTCDEFLQVSLEARMAAAAAKEKYAEKEALLQRMKDLMRANVRYAEGKARHDQKKLELIGWGPRKKKGKSRSPGQVLGLEVVEEGPGWIFLAWSKPREGGAAGAYKVRMCGSDGVWKLAESTVDTEVRLEGLECGVTLSFLVTAINKVGEGIESSTVSAILPTRSAPVPWVPPPPVNRE